MKPAIQRSRVLCECTRSRFTDIFSVWQKPKLRRSD